MKRLLPIIPIILALALPNAALSEEDDTGSDVEMRATYRLDTRIMSMDGDVEPHVMAAEADVSASFGTKVDAVVQVPFYTAMRGRGKGMHFGNAYAIFKQEIGKPTLKLGQFVIPFGNLADYETHTRVLQTLYPYSLGTRIDLGAQVDGFIDADTEYAVAVTTGNGPYRRDNNGNKVVTARVARRMMVGEDDLKVGISYLKGKLPVFSLMHDPLMDGNDALLLDVETGMMVPQSSNEGFADNTRYGIDIEYYRGIDLIRAEIVAGNDDGKSVTGYWLQVEHPLSYKTQLIGQAAYWSQAFGHWRNLALGVEHKLQDNKILRFAYENRKATENDMTMKMNLLTLQYLLEF